MYKTLKADRDAYITNRVINDKRRLSSNTGAAGTLDLYKLYGFSSSGSIINTELTRLLLHFDLQPIRDLITAGKISINNPSFTCTLKLSDVYGGQPTPKNFTAVVYPLSRSFDEGVGRDIVQYADTDVCNFLSGSRAQGAWLLSGCERAGGATETVDYITSSATVVSYKASQLFVEGTEDLSIDVTTIVSATLKNELPDQGFRVSFDPSLENDTHTYFVKRFVSRTAFSEAMHPKLVFRYDDSIQDDSQSLFFDSQSYLFLYNYSAQTLSNITSGSTLTQITGSNSLILKLVAEVSGGIRTLFFTGSQHKNGSSYLTGIYSASVSIPSTDSLLMANAALSSSVRFTPVWGSLDGTVAYLTGSAIYAYPSLRGGASLIPKRYVVSVLGLHADHFTDEESTFKINIFDYTTPVIRASRLPVELPGIVVRDVHYQIRDNETQDVIVPFDTDKNSTRASSDEDGMYFKLDMSNLTAGHSYVIDVLINSLNNRQVYRSASPVFRVKSA